MSCVCAPRQYVSFKRWNHTHIELFSIFFFVTILAIASSHSNVYYLSYTYRTIHIILCSSITGLRIKSLNHHQIHTTFVIEWKLPLRQTYVSFNSSTVVFCCYSLHLVFELDSLQISWGVVFFTALREWKLLVSVDSIFLRCMWRRLRENDSNL